MRETLKLNLFLSVFLVVANVAAFNLIFNEVDGLRVDMTEGNIYSLSEVTENILENLGEEVRITGYFSEPDKIEEAVRPYVTEIKDILREYEAVGDGMIKLEFVTPETDEAKENEAQSKYGVEPIPYAYQDDRQSGISSYYFAIAIEYATAKPVTVSGLNLFRRSIFNKSLTLEIANVEFELTRAIKKAVYGFESQRDIFDKLDEKASILTYMTAKDQLPQMFQEIPANARKVLDELEKAARGKLLVSHQSVPDLELIINEKVKDDDPKKAEALALLSKLRGMGIEPTAMPFGEQKPFFLWGIVTVGEDPYLVPLMAGEGALGEAELREKFESFFKRRAKGLRRRIGVAQHRPEFNPMMMQMGQRPPPAPFGAIEGLLSNNFEIEPLDLNNMDQVPAGVDVLLVLGPKDVKAKAVYAIDQFVMRGGPTIICADRHEAGGNIVGQDYRLTPHETGLEGMLAHWGVTLSEEAVLDWEGGQFFFPRTTFVSTTRGQQARQRLEDILWPIMPVLGGSGNPEGLNREDAAFLGGAEVVRLRLPSEVSVEPKGDVKATRLFRSSADAWQIKTSDRITPDFDKDAERGFEKPDDDKLAKRPLGWLLQGKFKSYFADKPIPFGGDEEKEETADGEDKPEETAPKDDGGEFASRAPLKESYETRLVIIGNDDWIDGLEYAIMQQLGDYPLSCFRQNFAVFKDTIDWMLEDEDLIKIRGSRRTFRPLERTDEDQQRTVKLLNFFLPTLLVIVMGAAVFFVRAGKKSVI